VDRLWHRAVVEDDDAVVAELRRRARQRCDFKDAGADEAGTLAAYGDHRRAVLSTLVSEQLTSECWRDGSGAWSLSETVEVVVYHLNAAGRYNPASELVANLLMAVRRGGAMPRSPPARDRAAAERLIAATRRLPSGRSGRARKRCGPPRLTRGSSPAAGCGTALPSSREATSAACSTQSLPVTLTSTTGTPTPYGSSGGSSTSAPRASADSPGTPARGAAIPARRAEGDHRPAMTTGP
jgi:hypothetical protein